jgi:predicted Zn-dependent protease
MNLNGKKSQQSSNKSNQIVNYISTLINDGKYGKALKEMQNYERRNPDNQTLKINKCSFLIDIGFNLNNVDLVKQGLKIGEETLNSQTANKDKANIYYNLANGYYNLFAVSENKSGIETVSQSQNLQKAKSYYRSAIELLDEYDFNLKKRLWVNYGNCLTHLYHLFLNFLSFLATFKNSKLLNLFK